MKQIQVERLQAQQKKNCIKLVTNEGKKIVNKKLYVQNYDKKLFISKHPYTILKDKQPKAPSRKTTLKWWNKQLA